MAICATAEANGQGLWALPVGMTQLCSPLWNSTWLKRNVFRETRDWTCPATARIEAAPVREEDWPCKNGLPSLDSRIVMHSESPGNSNHTTNFAYMRQGGLCVQGPRCWPGGKLYGQCIRSEANRSRFSKCRLLSTVEDVIIRFHSPILCAQKRLLFALQLPWPTFRPNTNRTSRNN